MPISSMSRHAAAAAALALFAGATLSACGGERTPLEPNTTQVGAPTSGGPTGTTTTPSNGTPTAAPAGGGGGAPTTGIGFLTGSRWGTVGTRLLITPAVRVLDDAGRPVAGVRVTFAAAAGSGTVAGTEQTTDARGIAAPDRWTLGTVAGTQTLVASAAGYAQLSFSVTAEAGPASRVVVVEGDGQTATVMTPVAVSPLVRVTDEYGNGIPRIEVRFTADGVDGAFVQSPFLRTDATGAVRAGRWNVGKRPGRYTMTATALPFSPAPFSATLSATAVAGAPARLRVLEGDWQTAPAGTTLPIAPAVYVTDGWGNRLAAPGIRVVFRAFGGSGTVTGAEQITDADGVARVGSWTLGPLQTSLEPTPQLLLVEAPAFQPNVSGAAFRATAR
ncbi:MAG TPA: hypothetical protein VKA84_10355 [Gemmatimonadaceae bacterium]|nr:hypothetical protein [Gemmatimonadaceae bacterium]